MKVIDLLNKIANKEEVPKRIKYDEKEYYYGKYLEWYISDDMVYELYIDKYRLNDEIEIIEDTPIISKLYVNNELQYDLTSKEDKKIPEKLNLKLDDWTTPTQCDIELSKKIDEIIDYIKSKGDE